MRLGFLCAIVILPVRVLAQEETARRTVTVAASDESMLLIRGLADAFAEEHRELSVVVAAAPERRPLQAIQDGDGPDLVALARPLTLEERDGLLAPKQPSVLGVPVAVSAVVLVVHPQNRCRELTTEQAGNVLAGAVVRWDQLGVGGSPVFDEPVGGDGHAHRHSEEDEGPGGDEHQHPEEVPSVVVHRPRSESDCAAALVRRSLPGTIPTPYRDGLALEAIEASVARDPLSIGITRFGELRGLRVLSIAAKGGGRGVLPTAESLVDRTYPLSHFVYLFHRADGKEDALAFVQFATSAAGQKVVRGFSSFLPLPAPATGDLVEKAVRP